MLMQLARWAGADVFASDAMDDRLAVSRALGASSVLDARKDVVGGVRGLTDGRGVDCVLLAAVGPAAFTQAVDSTRPGGRIVVFSATSPGEMAQVDLGRLTVGEKQILTSYSASVDVQDLAARLVFDREINVRDLVTHRFPLSRAVEAVQLASRPAPGVLKVVVDTREPA